MTLTDDQITGPFIRMPYKRMGISRRVFARLVDQGEFPEGIRVSPQTIVWPEHIVDEFMQQCVRAQIRKTK